MFIINEIKRLLKYDVEKEVHINGVILLKINEKETLNVDYFKTISEMEMEYGIKINTLYLEGQEGVCIRIE